MAKLGGGQRHAVPPDYRNGQRNQHRRADQGAPTARVIHPFAHADAANVQQRRQPKQAHGEQEKETRFSARPAMLFGPA